MDCTGLISVDAETHCFAVFGTLTRAVDYLNLREIDILLVVWLIL